MNGQQLHVKEKNYRDIYRKMTKKYKPNGKIKRTTKL